MNIFVSGSLAYDRIMDFRGKFAEHIMPDKIHILNVSFTVDGMVERFGGTAGNIAYALALLGETPTILATIGHDYQMYFEWLGKNHLSSEGIRVIEQEFTASAYIITDLRDNQITGFNPGAMKHPSRFNFDAINTDKSIAVIAAGNLEDMLSYSRIYKARGIDYISDPGQSIPSWGAAELKEYINGPKMLICNDYELEMIMNKTELDRARLLELAEIIIVTKGELGSVVLSADGELDIPAVKPKKLVDPTGAGDAYRGGLIKGWIMGKDIKYCALMGAVSSSFVIEAYGTQGYSFTVDEFMARFEENFAGSE